MQNTLKNTVVLSSFLLYGPSGIKILNCYSCTYMITQEKCLSIELTKCLQMALLSHLQTYKHTCKQTSGITILILFILLLWSNYSISRGHGSTHIIGIFNAKIHNFTEDYSFYYRCVCFVLRYNCCT